MIGQTTFGMHDKPEREEDEVRLVTETQTRGEEGKEIIMEVLRR